MTNITNLTKTSTYGEPGYTFSAHGLRNSTQPVSRPISEKVYVSLKKWFPEISVDTCNGETIIFNQPLGW